MSGYNPPTNSAWEPVVSSTIAALAIGVPGIYALTYGTTKPRKNHMMNVFSQLFYALFSTAMVIRLFYMFTWFDRRNGLSVGMRAFLITYPQMNILICAFLIQYPWLYDFILLQNGRHITLVLRQQMKMFVVAANIFTILMYIVYAFTAFPMLSDENDSKLVSLFSTLTVFNMLSAILVLC